MEWFPLALISAFTLASADAATKRYLGDYSGRELVLVRITVTGALLLPLAFLFPLPAVPAAFWGIMAVLVPLELAAMWLYMTAIRDAPLHLTLPYLAFTPVLNILTGWLLLGETITPAGGLGIALVVAGAWLLNSVRGQRWQLRQVLAPFRAIGREPGSRKMLGVAAIYSITSVLGKAALAYADPLTFGPFYFAFVGGATLLLFALFDRRSLRVLTRRPAAHLLVAGASAAMVITHFFAIAQVEVAYFVAVKRSSLLFGILYGALLFREANLRRNLAAGSLMVVGVAVIVL